MKNFLKNLFVFFFISIIIGELIIRITHTVADIPQRKIDEYGIQKYYPNQSGYWKGGKHKWMINKLGWPGNLPKDYNNLITVIGDSYIENFMNPNECHQSVLLKKKLDNYNFIEAGRSGVSFIEAMEISKQFDSLNPIYNLVYVNNNDFYESVSNIRTLADITQLNVETHEIIYGKMKSPGLKKILYNWKLLYYFYNNYPLNFSKSKNKIDIKKKKRDKIDFKYINEIKNLLEFVKQHYNLANKILVFHPKSKQEIINLCKQIGFNVIVLSVNEDDKSWSFEHDSHWTCYGHNQVANQVTTFLKK